MKVNAALVSFLMLVTVVLGPLVVWSVARWIVQPVDLAAKNRRHPTQFTLVDFFCLFVLIQVPTALIHSIKVELGVHHQEIYLLDGYAWFACALIWWKCVGLMSRAGIQKPAHRVVLLVFVLPVAFAGALLPFVFAMVTAIGMLKFRSPERLVGTAVFLAAAVPAAMIVCARLTRRIVAASDAITQTVVEVVEEKR